MEDPSFPPGIPQLGKTRLSGLLAVGAWDWNPGEVSGPRAHI